MIDKEFTIDFCQFFDIVVDVSQVTNSYLFGSKFLQHQENYMVDRFIQNIVFGYRAYQSEVNFDLTQLKCE